MRTPQSLSDIVRSLAGAAVLASSVVALSACYATSGGLYVETGPPAPIVEAVVVSPGPEFVWVPGYYRWDGGAYLWMAGRWERPPHGQRRWVPGSWDHSKRGWRYREGRWR
jgi:hypothetical protein